MECVACTWCICVYNVIRMGIVEGCVNKNYLNDLWPGHCSALIDLAFYLKNAYFHKYVADKVIQVTFFTALQSSREWHRMRLTRLWNYSRTDCLRRLILQLKIIWIWLLLSLTVSLSFVCIMRLMCLFI